MPRALMVLLTMLLVVSLRGVASAQPSLLSHVDGFTDVNGNGVLDCGEPVAVTVAFATNNSGSGALSGTLTLPAGGSAGLVYQAGSLTIDPELTNGCSGQIAEGDVPGDGGGRIEFSCPADPVDNNAWILVAHYRGTYYDTAGSGLTATATAVTSDGTAYRASGSLGAAETCSGAPSGVTVSKSAAGPATPGSTLLYTLTATDVSGLGDGGLQLVDTVPEHATFDAGASSAGWVCAPDGSAGSVCRNPVGNVAPGGSVSRYFAVVLDTVFPAAPFAVSNTGCARSGPSVVVGCASVSTPAAGMPVLHLVKSVTGGSAVPGGTLTYGLAVSNAGNQVVADVVLRETVPLHTTFSAAGSSAGWTCAPGVGAGAACSLDVGMLGAGAGAAGQVRTFAVVVDDPLPALPAGATLNNTACVHASAAGVADACSSVSSPTTGMAVLHLTKSLTGGGGVPGSVLAYDLAVQNTGNEGASGLLVSETVPAHTTFAAAASAAGWVCGGLGGGSACSLTLGALAAGATVHVAFAVTLERPLAAGVGAVSNTACAAATQPAEVRRQGGGVGSGDGGGGGAGGCDTLATPTAGHPVITLVKSYSGGPARPGDVLIFELVAANTGDQDAGGLTLGETVPAHTRFVAEGSSAGWSCAAGGVSGASCTLAVAGLSAGAAGSAFRFAVQMDADVPASVQQIGNATCLTGAGGLSACGQASTPPAVALGAELTYAFLFDGNHNRLADPGDRIGYTLVVTNPSGGAAAGVHLVTPLDPHLVFTVGSVSTSAGTVTGGNGAGDSQAVVDVASLAPGGSVTVTFSGTVAAALPAGLMVLSTQSRVSGGNFSATVSGDPGNPVPLSPTTTPVGAAVVVSIPTLGGGGLVLLGVVLGVAGFRRLRGGAVVCGEARAHGVGGEPGEGGETGGAGEAVPRRPFVR